MTSPQCDPRFRFGVSSLIDQLKGQPILLSPVDEVGSRDRRLIIDPIYFFRTEGPGSAGVWHFATYFCFEVLRCLPGVFCWSQVTCVVNACQKTREKPTGRDSWGFRASTQNQARTNKPGKHTLNREAITNKATYNQNKLFWGPWLPAEDLSFFQFWDSPGTVDLSRPSLLFFRGNVQLIDTWQSWFAISPFD